MRPPTPHARAVLPRPPRAPSGARRRRQRQGRGLGDVGGGGYVSGREGHLDGVVVDDNEAAQRNARVQVVEDIRRAATTSLRARRLPRVLCMPDESTAHLEKRSPSMRSIAMLLTFAFGSVSAKKPFSKCTLGSRRSYRSKFACTSSRDTATTLSKRDMIRGFTHSHIYMYGQDTRSVASTAYRRPMDSPRIQRRNQKATHLLTILGS